MAQKQKRLPFKIKKGWHQRIADLIENLSKHKFEVDGVEYSRFNRENKNSVARRFLIMAGAIEPVGRLDKNMPESEFKSKAYRAIGGFYRGNRFIYKIDPDRLDEISQWIQSENAPQLVCVVDPEELKKRKRLVLMLVPKERIIPVDFPWYDGW